VLLIIFSAARHKFSAMPLSPLRTRAAHVVQLRPVMVRQKAHDFSAHSHKTHHTTPPYRRPLVTGIASAAGALKENMWPQCDGLLGYFQKKTPPGGAGFSYQTAGVAAGGRGAPAVSLAQATIGRPRPEKCSSLFRLFDNPRLVDPRQSAPHVVADTLPLHGATKPRHRPAPSKIRDVKFCQVDALSTLRLPG
jgi:hypothetical protein